MKSNINKRRIKALKKRLPVKTIANEIGISPSTLNRYLSGKIKNPKKDINNKVDLLFNHVKKKRCVTNWKEKEKIALELCGYSVKNQRNYKHAKSRQVTYKIETTNFSEIENIIQNLEEKQPDYGQGNKLVYINIVGIKDEQRINEETGEKYTVEVPQRFSTPFAASDDLAEIEKNLKDLLAKPSKTLKKVLNYEIVMTLK